MNSFSHISVLLKETVSLIVTKSDGIYVDCTVGGAGHGLAITNMLTENGWYICIDQDQAALDISRRRLFKARCKITYIKGNFHELNVILKKLNVDKVDGILFDLGVSSYQIDNSTRGFSYKLNGPLDMRMDTNNKISAYDIVNNYKISELEKIIREYGEERWARRISNFIGEARKLAFINSTIQLVEIIKKAIPHSLRRDGQHPAKKTFQAIRIAVNNELVILEKAFTDAVNKLYIGGRICIITFHSLEDRIVKKTFQRLAKNCICPCNFPFCVCENKPILKIINKPIRPSLEEIQVNHRARSAKLRSAEKI